MISRPSVSLARSCLLALVCALGAPVWAEPGFADVQNLLRQAKYPAALTRVDQLLAKDPRDAQARFAKGVILTELNRSNEAVAVYLGLIKDRPDLPEPYNNLAVIYAQQKQYDKAKAALELAIRTHPAYATAHENLGDIYAMLASQAYNKALQIDSANAHAQTKLAQIRELMSAPAAPRSFPVQPKAPILTMNSAKPAPAPASPTKPVAAPAPVKPIQVAKAEPAPAFKPTAKPVPLAKAEPKPEEKGSASPDPKASAKAAEKEAKRAAAKEAKLAAAKEAKLAAAKEAKLAAAKDSSDEAQIRKILGSWAGAWSRKDVRDYLAHYSSDFRTPNAMARKAWEAERESRLTKPGKIHVEVEGIKVKINGDEATVRFRQSYDSANLKSSSGKTMVLKRHNGRWQIQQERIGG